MDKKEFNEIVKDILDNQEFNKLSEELHHGITRYDHSLRVAKTTYKVGKFLRIKNLEPTTRAALLHDFYVDAQFNDEKPNQRLYLHPELACKNAKNYYEIDPMQENIIKAHMYPLKGEKPKYKETWLVNGVDKTVALYEMYRFKASLMINIWAIFLFNLLIQK